MGYPGNTVRCVVEDTARDLDYFSIPLTFNGQTIVAALLTVESGDIRFTLGESQTPTTVLGHRLDDGNQIRIVHPKAVKNLKMINRAVGVSAVVHITPEFNIL